MANRIAATLRFSNLFFGRCGLRFTPCPIQGGWLIDLEPRADERGYFARTWCAEEFAAQGISFRPVQANLVSSQFAGTIRGLHYQEAPHLEAKLVRCTRGSAFDVMVDMRSDSPTFRRWFGVVLSAENGQSIYVPERCAHGFQALEDASEIHYVASACYALETVRGVRFDDPSVGIQWPLPARAISERDRTWPRLEIRRESP